MTDRIRKALDLDFVVPGPGPQFRQEWCEAEIKDQPQGWRARRGYDNTCRRHAVYIVFGRKLCRIHAGAEILDQLFRDHPTHYYVQANVPRLQRRP